MTTADAQRQRYIPSTEVDISSLKWKDEVAHVADLDIDPTYQRHVVQRLVDAIAANYNPLLAGKLVVSRRNGTSYIVDGQQRWHGARAAGIDKVAVIGIYGLDRVAEARIFLALNQGRVAVRAIDNFRAAWHGGETYAIEINAVVEQHGGRVQGIRQPTQNSDVEAVEALRWIYSRGGIRGLSATLEVIGKAFGEVTKTTCPGLFTKGLFGVISLHRDTLDIDRLARQIGSRGTGEITQLAQGMGKVLGAAAGSRAYYMAILQAYNERLGKKAIDPAATLNRIGKSWEDE